MAIGFVATTTMTIRPVSMGWVYSPIGQTTPDVFSDVSILFGCRIKRGKWRKFVTLNIEEGVEPVAPEPKAVNRS